MKHFLSQDFLGYLKSCSKIYCKELMDSEDLVQDTILQILESKDKLDEVKNIKAWAKVIMKNIYLNKAKRDKIRQSEELKEDILYYSEEDDFEIEDLMQKLFTEEQIKIIRLRQEGFSIKEIAKSLETGRSESYIKSNIILIKAIIFKEVKC